MFDDNDPFGDESYQAPMGPNPGDYADDAKYYAGEGGRLAKIGMEKAKPFIILGIVAVVIIGFVLFYLSTQHSVTINIDEYGGSGIPARLLINSNGNKIYSSTEKLESHTMTLGNGDYTYSASATDHVTNRGSFTITGETTSHTQIIELEKDIDAELELTNKFEKIYNGQELNGVLIIKNVETDIRDEKLIVKDSKNLLDIEFDSDKININNGGSDDVSFTATVRSGAKLDETTTTKITLSIKGTKISTDFTVDVNPTIKLSDIVLSGTTITEKTKTISYITLEAGEDKKPIVITIANDDEDIDLDDLTIEITPDSSSSDKLNWFEFVNYEEVPTKKTIDQIKKDEKEAITLNISVPLTAEIDDEFKGKLTLTSNSLEDSKEYTVLFKVSKSKTVKLELSKTSLETKCYQADDDICTPIQLTFEKITLKNSGNVTINNILLEADDSLQSYALCADWFEPQSRTIPELTKDDPYTINMIITPTYNQTEGETCFLKWTFINPLTNQQETGLSEPITITTTYKEE
jgi:hypothetical protein